MDEFVQIWRLLTVLAASAIGLRLLEVAARSRGLPELIFGVSILLPCVGIVLREVTIAQGPSLDPERLFWLRVVTGGVFVIGPLGLYLGTWRIFRPRRLWAALLCVAASAALLAAPVLRLVAGPEGPANPPLAVVAVFAGGYAWTAVEAFLYSRQMRRRSKLGLDDPVTTTQFLLWGIASACGALAVLCTLVTLVFFGQFSSQIPVANTLSPALGAIWIVCLYLAFFPPLPFQEFLERRATAEVA